MLRISSRRMGNLCKIAESGFRVTVQWIRGLNGKYNYNVIEKPGEISTELSRFSSIGGNF